MPLQAVRTASTASTPRSRSANIFGEATSCQPDSISKISVEQHNELAADDQNHLLATPHTSSDPVTPPTRLLSDIHPDFPNLDSSPLPTDSHTPVRQGVAKLSPRSPPCISHPDSAPLPVGPTSAPAPLRVVQFSPEPRIATFLAKQGFSATTHRPPPVTPIPACTFDGGRTTNPTRRRPPVDPFRPIQFAPALDAQPSFPTADTSLAASAARADPSADSSDSGNMSLVDMQARLRELETAMHEAHTREHHLRARLASAESAIASLRSQPATDPGSPPPPAPAVRTPQPSLPPAARPRTRHPDTPCPICMTPGADGKHHWKSACPYRIPRAQLSAASPTRPDPTTRPAPASTPGLPITHAPAHVQRAPLAQPPPGPAPTQPAPPMPPSTATPLTPSPTAPTTSTTKPSCKHCGDLPDTVPHITAQCPLLHKCFTCGSTRHKSSICPLHTLQQRRDGAPTRPSSDTRPRPSFECTPRPGRDKLPRCAVPTCSKLAPSVVFFARELVPGRFPKARDTTRDTFICGVCRSTNPDLAAHFTAAFTLTAPAKPAPATLPPTAQPQLPSTGRPSCATVSASTRPHTPPALTREHMQNIRMYARIHRKRTRARASMRLALACAAAHACLRSQPVLTHASAPAPPLLPHAAQNMLRTCTSLHEIEFMVAAKEFSCTINVLYRIQPVCLLASSIRSAILSTFPHPSADRMLAYAARTRSSALCNAHNAAQRASDPRTRITAFSDHLLSATCGTLVKQRQHIPPTPFVARSAPTQHLPNQRCTRGSSTPVTQLDATHDRALAKLASIIALAGQLQQH